MSTEYCPVCENDEDETCKCKPVLKGNWIICPNCSGDGKHSKRFGSFTMSEFNDCFDPDEQEEYFAGAYDETCYTCRGNGKLREDDVEAIGRLEIDRENELIAETGRNSAGEPCW